MSRRAALPTSLLSIAATAALAPALVLGCSTTALAAPLTADGGSDTREPVVTAVPAQPVQAQSRFSVPTTSLPPLQFAQRMATTLSTTASASKYLGSALSALVVDPANGSVIWRYSDGRTRMPASTQKLLTAYTVLHSMDPSAVLTTRVTQSTQNASVIYLKGGGDPSLTVTRVKQLAATAAAALKLQGRTSVQLYLDRSIFPTSSLPSGWKSSYLTDVQLPVGLTLAGYRKADGPQAAGRALVAALKPLGITATLRTSATSPSSATTLASSSSARISSMVAWMLNASVNDYAEFLLRHAALAGGQPATWKGAVTNEIAVLGRASIPLGGVRIVDGSGLSRSTRVSPAAMAAVVRALWNDPEDKATVFAWGALPTAGRTGTLATRFRSTDQKCAAGLVQAKTGTLSDVVALAGVAHSSDGRERVFVFLENGIVGKNTAVRSAVDSLATTVVGCRLG